MSIFKVPIEEFNLATLFISQYSSALPSMLPLLTKENLANSIGMLGILYH
jgi:hypothetical protein